tara:strand:+ start:983 stop:1150 length:168 start_codon:yes stop_codon:yes gene_type:complete
MSFKIKKVKKIDRVKHLKSISRIYTSQMKLGESVERDRKKYNRKEKYRKNYTDEF